MSIIELILADPNFEKLSQKLEEKIAEKLAVKKEAKKVYKLSEAADISRTHVNTLYRHIEAGLLKATKKGRNYIVKQEDLDDYISGKYL